MPDAENIHGQAAGTQFVDHAVRVDDDFANVWVAFLRHHASGLRKIREDPRTRAIPVVVMTSLNEGNGTTDEEWARRLEVSGFVSKPFDPDQAMAIIESVLPQKK